MAIQLTINVAGGDEGPVTISAAGVPGLSEADKLRVGQALTVAAIRLVPSAQSDGDYAGRDCRGALVTTMLDCVHVLLHSKADRERAQRLASLDEVQTAIDAYGLN